MTQNDEQRKVTLADPKDTPRPHPLASEMTEQELKRTPAERRENAAAKHTAGPRATTRGQRRVAARLFGFALLIVGLAIILSMIFWVQWSWPLFFIGLLILVCYMLLITAPFWLASTTKVAQDEQAKQVLERSPERGDQAPERRDG